jgi:hypothetical protein
MHGTPTLPDNPAHQKEQAYVVGALEDELGRLEVRAELRLQAAQLDGAALVVHARQGSPILLRQLADERLGIARVVPARHLEKTGVARPLDVITLDYNPPPPTLLPPPPSPGQETHVGRLA